MPGGREMGPQGPPWAPHGPPGAPTEAGDPQGMIIMTTGTIFIGFGMDFTIFRDVCKK